MADDPHDRKRRTTTRIDVRRREERESACVPRIMKVADAAALLDISLSAVYELIEEWEATHETGLQAIRPRRRCIRILDRHYYDFLARLETGGF